MQGGMEAVYDDITGRPAFCALRRPLTRAAACFPRVAAPGGRGVRRRRLRSAKTSFIPDFSDSGKYFQNRNIW
jgi:hypothetical protein